MKAPKPKQKELIPADTHLAICYGVVDLGTQSVEYPGKPPKDERQLMLQWELPNIRFKGEKDGESWDKPRVIKMTYNYSCYELANLSKHVTPWMGACPDDFDFESLIGQPCLLSIIHKTSGKGNDYAKVAGIMKVPAGTVVPEMENPAILYDMFTHKRNLPESMKGDNYEWLRKIIEGCKEFAMIDHASEHFANQDDPPLEDTNDYSDRGPEEHVMDDDEIPF